MRYSFKQDWLKMVIPGIFMLLCMNLTFAQSKAAKIEELMDQYTEFEQFNGSVLVAEHGEVIYAKGHGLANMEFDIPNKPDTKHRLGSITKQFTAALILQLVEQGKLELNEPVSTYLPNYKGPATDKVNIHHLLNHTSGIPNYTSFPGFFENQSRNPYTPAEFVKVFADSTLQFIPGEKFAYSNSGYFLLGHLIEEVTGKSYETVLQEQILDPLHMKNTGYDHHGKIIKNRASGYQRSGDEYTNAPYLDMSIPYAAGSLYSTVEDLYLWDQALYSDKILSEESKKLMFSPHIKDGDSYYAYGWVLGHMRIGETQDSIGVIAHGGGINGFNTIIARIPSEKDLIVLLNNTGSARLRDIAASINNILHDAEYEMPKKSIAMEVMPLFMDKGILAGRELYLKLKADENYTLNENEMNAIGYRLLQKGKVEEAIEVFTINLEEFPDSWNVYDSLGEAYMADRKKDLSIKNYKKSIEMNPENTNGIKMLKKLESL